MKRRVRHGMEAELGVTVKMFLDARETVDAVVVDAEGDRKGLPFLVPVTLDKLLVDAHVAMLPETWRDAEAPYGVGYDLVEKVRGRVSWYLAGERDLSFGMPLTDSVDRSPDVSVTIEIGASWKRQRFGDTSESKPYWRTPLPYWELADVALCSVWDWTLLSIEPDDLELMVKVLDAQFQHYNTYGLPRAPDGGRAVFHAALSTFGDASAVVIPRRSRQALLERLAQAGGAEDTIAAIRAVGTSRAVALTKAQKRRLLEVCESWLEEVNRPGLPERISDLRNALIAEQARCELDEASDS